MALEATPPPTPFGRGPTSGPRAVPRGPRPEPHRRASSWQHIRTLHRARQLPAGAPEDTTLQERLGDIGLSLGSLAASVCLTSLLEPLGLLAYGVLVPHEFSHQATAKVLGVESKPPIFIPVLPIVIGCVGITRIRPCPTPQRRAIAIAGPTTGIALSLGLMTVGGLLASPFLTVLASLFLLEESVHLVLGHDRKVMHADFSSPRMDSFT